VRGRCVGGGLALAAACDLRVAVPVGRFGVPIARTLGNCLSMNSVSLLVSQLGPARSLDLLLRRRLLTAEQAHAPASSRSSPTTTRPWTRSRRRGAAAAVARPLTMWAAKQAVTRLRRATLPDGDDFVARTFGSDDFHGRCRSFSARERPVWQGR
jgi:enoyl-CoA hydratase/carnithine racemase